MKSVFRRKAETISVIVILSITLLLGCLFIYKDRQSTSTDANGFLVENNFVSSSPEEQGMASEKICEMLNHIKETQKDIHSVLIVRNGSLVTEAYFYPYKKDYPHALYSCTKSIMSALIGMSIHEGSIKSVDQKITDFLNVSKEDTSESQKDSITLQHLLEMSAGLSWVENGMYGHPSDPTTQMIQSESPIKYVLDRPMEEVPGKRFHYSSGVSHLLSGVFQKARGSNTFDYAKKKLFEPLGIQNIHWESDKEGITFGGFGIYMTPMDMAKFGQLYLQKGRWGKQQIVPENWVDESTQNRINTSSFAGGAHGYGYQWWMNRFGGYSARGHGGQYIFVVPEHELVVVFTSSLSGYDYVLPQTLVESYILPAITSTSPIKSTSSDTEVLEPVLEEISTPPEPQPVPSLPAVAEKISGKTYVLEDSRSISLTFNEGTKCLMALTERGSKVTFAVGLDDVYRIANLGSMGPLPNNNEAAVKGHWENDHTFVLVFKGLESADEVRYVLTFEGNDVTLKTHSKLAGTIVEEAKGKQTGS